MTKKTKAEEAPAYVSRLTPAEKADLEAQVSEIMGQPMAMAPFEEDKDEQTAIRYLRTLGPIPVTPERISQVLADPNWPVIREIHEYQEPPSDD
jgi:hypothetical protein